MLYTHGIVCYFHSRKQIFTFYIIGCVQCSVVEISQRRVFFAYQSKGYNDQCHIFPHTAVNAVYFVL